MAALIGCVILGFAVFAGTRASAHHRSTDGVSLVGASVDGRANTPAATPSAPRTADAPYAVDPATVSSSAAVVSPPVRVTIASIGVNSSLQSLGLLANGTLAPPSTWDEAGWYDGGVIPGQVGPAVVIGHIDSTSGPAVFFKLSKLQPGANVTITLQDGVILTFQVDDTQSFPKDQFPTAYVYGPTPDPELRLITCTGDFDYKTHNYLSNLVVRAHLVSSAG